MVCNQNQEDQGFSHSRSILARVLHSMFKFAGGEILGSVVHCYVNQCALWRRITSCLGFNSCIFVTVVWRLCLSWHDHSNIVSIKMM